MTAWTEETKRYTAALRKRHFTVYNIEEKTPALTIIEANTMTKRGLLSVYLITNGNCRVDKPNGTHKWLYQKTMPQLFRAIDQSLEYYNA